MNQEEFDKIKPIEFGDEDLIDGRKLILQSKEGKIMPEVIKIRTKDGDIFVYEASMSDDNEM